MESHGGGHGSDHEALNGTEAPNTLAYVLAMDPNALCSPFGTQTEKETNGI